MANRIGVDCDGVLANFHAGFINLLVKQTGIDLFQPKPYVPEVWNYARAAGYSNADHLNECWDTIHTSEDFWELLGAYPETPEILAQLYGRVLKGDDVYFITTRPSSGLISAKYQTEMWLQDHYPGSSIDEFVPTVIITATKGKVASALNLTHFIDDKWENCVDVEVSTDDCVVYLLDRPWNQGVEDGWVQRVGSVVDMLKEMD